jgi:hypothetical protein
MSDDQTYGGSSKVAATFHGADQDRVDRVDTAALRREYRSASRQDVLALCDEVDRLRSLIERTEDGWRRTNTECIKHWNRADAAEAEVDRLTETLNRVRALHVPIYVGTRRVCLQCHTNPWPCPTATALDGPAPTDPRPSLRRPMVMHAEGTATVAMEDIAPADPNEVQLREALMRAAGPNEARP